MMSRYLAAFLVVGSRNFRHKWLRSGQKPRRCYRLPGNCIGIDGFFRATAWASIVTLILIFRFRAVRANCTLVRGGRSARAEMPHPHGGWCLLAFSVSIGDRE